MKKLTYYPVDCYLFLEKQMLGKLEIVFGRYQWRLNNKSNKEIYSIFNYSLLNKHYRKKKLKEYENFKI